MFFFFLFNVAFTHKVIYMFSDLVFCLLLVVYMKLCVLLKHDFHLLPAMASRLVAFYSNLVKRRPFVTQVLTAGTFLDCIQEFLGFSRFRLLYVILRLQTRLINTIKAVCRHESISYSNPQ